MEFLIPGLLLVGFMVWASTRIKRNAAKAFEAEQIETPEFSLSKPDGFLSIVDPPAGLLFSAYSKEFGEGDTSRVRRATAELSRLRDASLRNIAQRAKGEALNIVSEDTGIIGGRKCANIVTRRSVDGVTLETHYQIVAGADSVYQLVVSILPEYKEELQPKVDQLIGSLSIT